MLFEPFQLSDGKIMAMNYPDKQEDLTKDEWMDRLHAMRVTRADMNRLIMNYLVTGTATSFYSLKTFWCLIVAVNLFLSGKIIA